MRRLGTSAVRPVPRARRFGALVVAATLVGACGSGQDPTVEGGAGTSTTAVAGDGAGVATADTAPAASVPSDGTGGADATGALDPAPPAGAPGGSSGDDAVPGAGVAAATNPPPAPGTYTYRTTGTAPPESLLGPPRQVDEETVTTITALSADTVRITSAAAGGDQTTDLRFEPTRVALLVLEVSFGGQSIRFADPAGVTFAPVPPTDGQTWSGQLRDDGGQLTATFDGATRPVEAITVLGRSVQADVIDATITITGTYGGFPVDATVALRAWIDPALRTQVRTHQVTTTRQPFASTSDTTSELVGVTPA